MSLAFGELWRLTDSPQTALATLFRARITSQRANHVKGRKSPFPRSMGEDQMLASSVLERYPNSYAYVGLSARVDELGDKHGSSSCATKTRLLLYLLFESTRRCPTQDQRGQRLDTHSRLNGPNEPFLRECQLRGHQKGGFPLRWAGLFKVGRGFACPHRPLGRSRGLVIQTPYFRRNLLRWYRGERLIDHLNHG